MTRAEESRAVSDGERVRTQGTAKPSARSMLWHRISLSLKFSFFVFVVLLLSNVVVFALSLAAGIPESQTEPYPTTVLAEVLIACVVVGTLVAVLAGDIPMKPVRKVIDGIDGLAGGHFETRLDLAHPSEFRALSDSFNHMAAELGSVEMLRTDFVNNFSHEFKTPIASIKGFAEQLRNENLTDDERREYLDIIIKESNRLAKLSTDVLELSKLENQTRLPTMRAFNLSEQVRRSILLLETHWEQKDIALDVDLDEVAYCDDEDMLTQVWINVLDNAVKFTPHGGFVQVRLRKAANGSIAFAVADSGIGMDEATAARIFDKFYQGDTSHATMGNGIGLPLARRIVELHGGSMSVRSKLGEGAEFAITLPQRNA